MLDFDLKEKLIEEIVYFLKNGKAKKINYNETFFIENKEYQISFILPEFGVEQTINLLLNKNKIKDTITIDIDKSIICVIDYHNKNFTFIVDFILTYFYNAKINKIERAIELLKYLNNVI